MQCTLRNGQELAHVPRARLDAWLSFPRKSSPIGSAKSYARRIYTYIYMYASARLGGKSPPNANRHRYIRELRFERFQAVHMHNGLRAPLTYMHGSARIQHGRLAHTSSRHVGATYIEDGPPYMPTSESNVL